MKSNLYTHPLFYALIAFLKKWAKMEKGASKKKKDIFIGNRR